MPSPISFLSSLAASRQGVLKGKRVYDANPENPSTLAQTYLKAVKGVRDLMGDRVPSTQTLLCLKAKMLRGLDCTDVIGFYNALAEDRGARRSPSQSL